ncbi:MAG: thioesterase family protein [Longimicrobiales bacterium]|nr:thioesterase family protein [Longimicrobiales bacterium]
MSIPSLQRSPRDHSLRLRARSYELDSFGHVNHAVYLNYFEHARFAALTEGGFPPRRLAERGEGVHVVRVEVDFRRELCLGEEIEVRTRALDAGASSMTIGQQMVHPDDPDTIYAEARVVVVWVGPDRRPMRVPEDVRDALGLPRRGHRPGGSGPSTAR